MGAWNTSNGNKAFSTVSGGTSKDSWTDGNNAVFSAGTDGTGSYVVTVSTVNVNSINVEEGNPTFTGGTITFGDSTPDFTVAAGSTATVNSGLAGTNGLTKLGAGTLVFGTTDKAYTGTTLLSAGTLQLDFNQSFGTVQLAGGKLLLNSATTTITTLNITANSTIDFATAATLSVTNLTLSAGVTLTIDNWSQAADYFYATNWAGAVKDLPNNLGAAPMNQITFTGFNANQTGWDSYDSRIRPNVPEPATYGMFLVGALTAMFGWRRYRLAGLVDRSTR